MSIFTLLFGSDSNLDDGWTQPQREAVIDLLSVAIYADSHLSLAEQSAVDTQVHKMYWDSQLSVEAYSNGSINRARDARNNPDLKADYLQNIADKLETEIGKTKAYEICRSVLLSDGQAETEVNFLANVKSVFGI